MNLTWNERFELAKSYYEHYGHLRISSGFKTKNGIDYDSKGFLLGRWINSQRAQYVNGELTETHRQKLESIGMIFENVNDFEWNKFYGLAEVYLKHYHDLMIPKDFRTLNGYEKNEKGKNLGAWFKVQQTHYNAGTLSQERSEKIALLFNTLKRYVDSEWLKMYGLAKKYYEEYNGLIVKKNSKLVDENGKEVNILDLNKWVCKQRRDYKNNKLSKERIKMLESIGMVFENILEVEWERMYTLATIYYKQYGHLKVKRSFKTKNGIDFDEKGSPLGKWINSQYSNYVSGNLSQEHIEKLKKIGMIFYNQKEKNWNKMLELAEIYCNHHGDLNIEINFKTTNGYEYDEDGKPLGRWISRQSANFRKGTLTKIHQQKLNSIGINFEKHNDLEWDKMYNLAKAYFEYHHHLNIKADFKTINGYEYDEEGYTLGHWVYKQRSYFNSNSMSNKRIKKLEQIGMVFENLHDINWERMYALAKIYYEHYHHLKIPTNFKTINGHEYDEKGENLSDWISYQRISYNAEKLSEIRIKKLEQIEMVFENLHDVKWEKMYALAKSYYTHHYDLKVKANFKTINGYEYDEEGEKLGQWISYQRMCYKTDELSETRIKKLQLIGMIFEISKDKKQNEQTCKSYDIDYKKYKKEIDAIPHREFIAKINYLNNNGIPFVVEQHLNPIFFMSSINMEVRYGITLEQIINDYNAFVEKAKQKVKINEVV